MLCTSPPLSWKIHHRKYNYCTTPPNPAQLSTVSCWQSAVFSLQNVFYTPKDSPGLDYLFFLCRFSLPNCFLSLKGQSHKICLIRFFFSSNSSNWSHYRCPRFIYNVVYFFAELFGFEIDWLVSGTPGSIDYPVSRTPESQF